jgi:hypothetical protein
MGLRAFANGYHARHVSSPIEKSGRDLSSAVECVERPWAHRLGRHADRSVRRVSGSRRAGGAVDAAAGTRARAGPQQSWRAVRPPHHSRRRWASRDGDLRALAARSLMLTAHRFPDKVLDVKPTSKPPDPPARAQPIDQQARATVRAGRHSTCASARFRRARHERSRWWPGRPNSPRASPTWPIPAGRTPANLDLEDQPAVTGPDKHHGIWTSTRIRPPAGR